MSDTVIITGINGQLAQFMALHLLETEPGLRIIGTLRHKSYDNQPYLFDRSRITTELMDLSDAHSIEGLILRHRPAYFINTAANAFVGESWQVPAQHFEINALAVLHQLEAIRKHSPQTRYFNMGTSEEFGVSEVTEPQGEATRLDPRSPYGASKCSSRHIVSVWRRSYGLYALQGWTFNFESEIRGEKYVTRKVTKAVARIAVALRAGQPFEPLELGNLDSHRSWQFAGDVADGIWRMLNQERYRQDAPTHDPRYAVTGPNAEAVSARRDLIEWLREYVLSAPDTVSVRTFVEQAFTLAGIPGVWWDSGARGDPLDQVYLLADRECPTLATKRAVPLVRINPAFFRPADVTYLHGDASAARRDLGWSPKVSFGQLVERMVKADLEAAMAAERRAA